MNLPTAPNGAPVPHFCSSAKVLLQRPNSEFLLCPPAPIFRSSAKLLLQRQTSAPAPNFCSGAKLLLQRQTYAPAPNFFHLKFPKRLLRNFSLSSAKLPLQRQTSSPAPNVWPICSATALLRRHRSITHSASGTHFKPSLVGLKWVPAPRPCAKMVH